jgi:hypothetical protein
MTEAKVSKERATLVHPGESIPGRRFRVAVDVELLVEMPGLLPGRRRVLCHPQRLAALLGKSDV